MAKTLRLHTLAKELGIPSKLIIDKCRAEGVEIKNHMAAIPLGLAESIREWFSAGDDVTTVEVASRVDFDQLERIRETSRGKRHHAEDQSAAVEVLEETEETSADHPPQAPDLGLAEEAAPEPARETSPVVHSASAPAEADVAEVAEVAEVEAPEPSSAPPAIAARSDEPDAAPSTPTTVEKPAAPVVPAGVRHTPPRPPEVVLPAGPRHVPKPAELRGPRVVRIERPDSVPAPRPRPGGPLSPAASGADRSGVAPSPGVGVRGRPRTAEEEEREKLHARSRSPRRQGRTVDLVIERLKEWRDQDLLERKERLASASGLGLRARRSAERRRQVALPAPGGALRRAETEIVAPLSVKDFCSAVGVPFSTVSKKLAETGGKLLRINESIDAETAELVAMELGITVKITRAMSAGERLRSQAAGRERTNLQPRPPVVAMLGHVDHGKTSLLDAIRQTHVAAGEAGGITQHIGAYRIDRGDWHVTFLDTPGHAAFTAMRERGANLTDIVVLVVAADDGVMPQTVEAINHARAAGVQIVVALNKIDLPGADTNKVFGQLSEHNLTPTEWGGETDVLKTSATSGVGIDELLAHLSTLSDLLGLKADPDLPAQAVVIEAQMRPGRGVVAQVLVREGTLKPGQFIVCGPGAGRVRALVDDRGKHVNAATPGTPVEVVGLDELPAAGDALFVVKTLDEAKQIAQESRIEARQAALVSRAKPQTLEELLRGTRESEVPELSVIVRADVQGSIDALNAKLKEFPSEKVRLRILHSGVGQVTEADVELARASSAVIIAYWVVPDERARQAAERAGVEIRQYKIIYEVLDDVQRALEGLLEPIESKQARGRVEVREVFNITRVGRIAGCFVVDGIIARSHRVRLLRDGRVIVDDAAIGSLKRFKDDAREVRAGLECGVRIEGFDDVKPGDVLEAFEVVQVAQKLT